MSKDNAVTSGDKAIADALLGIGPAAEIKKPDWGYWAQLQTVRLNDAVLLSLNICPDWVEGESGVIRVDASLKTALENRKRITANRAADILPMLAIVPEHARLAQDVGLADFAVWAASTMKWADLPPQFVAISAAVLPAAPVVNEIAKTTAPVPKLRAQENRILELLENKQYDALHLPIRAAGKSGVKSVIRVLALSEPALFTPKTFNSAWQRLRDDCRVAGGASV